MMKNAVHYIQYLKQSTTFFLRAKGNSVSFFVSQILKMTRSCQFYVSFVQVHLIFLQTILESACSINVKNLQLLQHQSKLFPYCSEYIHLFHWYLQYMLGSTLVLARDFTPEPKQFFPTPAADGIMKQDQVEAENRPPVTPHPTVECRKIVREFPLHCGLQIIVWKILGWSIQKK